jgi:hypothetical protein
MEVILFWTIIGGFVGALIGQRKGRTGEGAVLGLILGPIGWLVVALGPDYKTAQESRKCPFCAELVKKEAKVCKHCGRDLPGGTNAAVQKTPVISRPLDPQPPSSRPKDRVFLIIIGLLCLIGLTYLVYVGRQAQTESKPNPTVASEPTAAVAPRSTSSLETATPEIRKAKPAVVNEPSATSALASSAEPDCAKKNLYPVAGDRGVLRTEKGEAQVWISTTISSCFVAVVATVEGNESPIQARTGELFKVPSGTKIVAVSVPNDGGLCEVREVRILSGPYAGRRGFVVYSWVARR